MSDPACPSFPVPLEAGRNVLRGDGCDLDGVVVRSGTTTVALHAGRQPQALSTDLGTMTVVEVSASRAVVDVVVEGTIAPAFEHTIVLQAPRLPFDGGGRDLPGFGTFGVFVVVIGVVSTVYRMRGTRRRDG